MQTLLAVAIGKLLRSVIRVFRRGGGSALPGVIASKIDPNLLSKAVASCPRGLVVVSGSAGKSSTTFQLVKVLENHGLRVFTNPSTANIKQGLYATVLKEANLLGRIDYDIAVLEWDEGHGAALSERLQVSLAVLTNVLSDQLDRFVDPELVTEKLQKIASRAQKVVLNADDKNLAQLQLPESVVVGYGLAAELLETHATPKYALNFGGHPEISRTALLTKNKGFEVQYGNESFAVPVDTPALGLNYVAALTAAAEIIELNPALVRSQFASNDGVFARNETTRIQGRDVNLRLVQNPTSFQLNLDELTGDEAPMMLMAGSDIHDPSWLWTVDFSKLAKVDIVGGSNAYELALRLRAAGIEIGEVLPEIPEASAEFFAKPGTKPTILFSADAMRRLRRHLKVAK